MARASATEGYTASEYLLTFVCELLRAANWQRANAGLPKAKQSKFPPRLPRPGLDRDEPAARAFSTAELQAAYERQRANVVSEGGDDP